MVLGNHREPLVQQVFEAVMISLDEEASAPQVRPPVPDGMDEADELPLIGGEGAVPGRDRPAEEGDWVAVLYQHRPKPMGRGIALNDEHLAKFGMASTGAEVTAALRTSKASVAALV
jgi:hypothetical protein